MLSLKKGTIAFNSHTILESIDLVINPSFLHIIIGPNGVGKTSLLKVLANPKSLSEGKIECTFKKSILIPQRVVYPEGITLFEYIASVFYQRGWKWFVSKEEEVMIRDILKWMNLDSKEDLPLSRLSAGELQLANVALAIVSGADFILLDEPSANLDLLNQIMILNYLQRIAHGGITIIAVMHDINLASKYGDIFIAIARDGELISGKKSHILTSENLSKVYNIDFCVTKINENLFIQPNI